MIKNHVIAVDAMGGDYAPREIVHGAYAASRLGIHILLFGDQLQIEVLLCELDAQWKLLPLTVVHTSEVVLMEDDPKVVTTKHDSSLVCAVKAVKDGHAGAIVSAGNSGAALVATVLSWGRVPGIQKPAIGGFVPTKKGSTFCIDLGGNIDCKPEHLYQFALMGQAYVSVFKGLLDASVGILANGTEKGKGTLLTRQAYDLLSQSAMKFKGNCEPYDILRGAVDVVVCDGFSGNVMLKSMEATAQVVMEWLKDEGGKSVFSRIAAYLSSPFLRRIKKQMVKGQGGGALLLGVQHPCIIAHGSARAQTIKDAICFAHTVVVEKKYSDFIRNLEQKLAERRHEASSSMQETIS